MCWDFQEGDVGCVKKSLLHYIENTGDADLVFLEMFKADRFQDFSFSEVAGSRAAGIGQGAFGYRQSDARSNTKRDDGGNAGMTIPCAQTIVG